MSNILADQRKRVRDSHRVQMAALGHKAEEGEEVGISVAGDTHITNITQPPEAKSGEPSMLKKGLGTAAALLIGSALPIAGFLLNHWLNKPAQPPAAVSPSDSAYDVIFYNSKGEVIDVPRHTE